MSKRKAKAKAKAKQVVTTLPEGNYAKYQREQVDSLVALIPETNNYIDGSGTESPLTEGEHLVTVTGETILIRWGEDQWLFLACVECNETGKSCSFPYNPTNEAHMELIKVGNILEIVTKVNSKGLKRSTSVDIKDGNL